MMPHVKHYHFTHALWIVITSLCAAKVSTAEPELKRHRAAAFVPLDDESRMGSPVVQAMDEGDQGERAPAEAERKVRDAPDRSPYGPSVEYRNTEEIVITKQHLPCDMCTWWSWNYSLLYKASRSCRSFFNCTQKQGPAPTSLRNRDNLYLHNNTRRGISVTWDNEITLTSRMPEDGSRPPTECVYLDGYRPSELFCATNSDISRIITRDGSEGIVKIYTIDMDSRGTISASAERFRVDGIDDELIPLYCATGTTPSVKHPAFWALGLEREKLYRIDVGHKHPVRKVTPVCVTRVDMMRATREYITRAHLSYQRLGMQAILHTTFDHQLLISPDYPGEVRNITPEKQAAEQ